MRILMCKDIPVLNMATLEMLSSKLLPGLLKKELTQSTLDDFMHNRRSLGSNEYARQMLNTIAVKNRNIVAETRAFSLSDCYWVKHEESETFEKLSPYYNYFWVGFGEYKGGPVPTVHTDGAVSKKWLDAEHLFKLGCLEEIEAAAMCHKASVPCVEIRLAKAEASEGIYVRNFTSPDIMFEPLSISGKVDQYHPIFSAEEAVEIFGEFGLMMLAVDAVIGNNDRHTGNAGFLRDTNTGEYVGFAPLFDFNHAKDYEWVPDPTTNRLFSIITDENRQYVISLTERLRRGTTDSVYAQRAAYILDRLHRIIR